MASKPPELTQIVTHRAPIQALLQDEARNHAFYSHAAVVGYDLAGEVVFVSSEMSRADLIALLTDVLDAVKAA